MVERLNAKARQTLLTDSRAVYSSTTTVATSIFISNCATIHYLHSPESTSCFIDNKSATTTTHTPIYADYVIRDWWQLYIEASAVHASRIQYSHSIVSTMCRCRANLESSKHENYNKLEKVIKLCGRRLQQVHCKRTRTYRLNHY